MTASSSVPLRIVTKRLLDPSGLGQVARHALQLGKPITAEECDALENGRVLTVDFPRPLSPANSNYVWTAFESDRIPPAWVEAINTCYRTVFVPHASVRSWFVASGVQRPVRVVHQGYQRLIRTAPLVAPEGPLRLGIIGVLVPRKNVEALIQAVGELRAAGRDIELDVQFTWWLIPEMQHIIDTYARTPWVRASFKKLVADDELADWYSRLHAYVLPSSGEGWSMTPRESLYLGIPTLISDIAPHAELLESGFCTGIAHAGKEPAYYPFLEDYCGEQYRIDSEAIKAALVELCEHYDEKLAASREGARWIAPRWTWRSALERLEQLIEADGAT